jgi:hypothetical protein
LTVAAALATGLAALGCLALVHGGHRPPTPPATWASPPEAESTWPGDDGVPAQPVDAPQLGALPRATTEGSVPAAPRDPAAGDVPSGRVVHPDTLMPGYSAPGGPAIVAIPPQQIAGSDTWFPVIAEQPGWVQVLLPVRPNGASAWLPLDGHLSTAHTPYLIRVDRPHFTLTVLRDNTPIGHWSVGIGQSSAPTPAGRAFVLAVIAEDQPTYSPIILPTSLHSDTFETYGGGVGTVGIHCWPNPAVFGTPSSAGCIRVPADALQQLSTAVPIGTPVLIT